MATQRIFDAEHHAQFVTFSCYRRRKLLDHPRVRDEFVGITAEKLAEHHGICSGFVVMPDHVYAIVWFAEAGALSTFMKSWKQTTSLRLKRMLRGVLPNYASRRKIHSGRRSIIRSICTATTKHAKNSTTCI